MRRISRKIVHFNRADRNNLKYLPYDKQKTFFSKFGHRQFGERNTVNFFREAPTAKVFQKPKPLTSTEEVDQHVSDLQHMIGAYSVVNTAENFHGGKIQYFLKTERKLHQILGLFNK